MAEPNILQETKPELNWNSNYRIVGKTIYKALLFSLKYLPAQLKLDVFQISLKLGDFWNENLKLEKYFNMKH